MAALTTLFGPRFQVLARRGRDFGLAFAAAHLVHLALVARLLFASPYPFPRIPLLLFSVGVFWIYLLAILSLSNKLCAWLGRRRWKQVRAIGVEYIAFAFAFDFGSMILGGNQANAIHYLPLLVVAVGGPILRLCAVIKRRAGIQHSAGAVPG